MYKINNLMSQMDQESSEKILGESRGNRLLEKDCGIRKSER